MTRASLLLALLAVSPVAFASDEPPPADMGKVPSATKVGVEALCAALATHLQASIPGQAVRLQVAAEGAAVDIAESVRTRCAAVLESGKPTGEPVPVHLRLRTSSASLLALVEIRRAETSVETLSAPLGSALESWLSGGAHGLETWLVGSVEGSVLALCGANGAVALVMPNQVSFVKWTASGLTPVAKVELPPTIRTHARAPAASAICRPTQNGMTLALGIHDRGKGGVLKFENDSATWTTPLDGIPVGFKDDGTPILAAADNAANTLRWKDRSLAQGALTGSTEDSLVGITPMGALVSGNSVGSPNTFGTGFAAADLDRDGVIDLVVTRPVFAGPGVEDRLSVRTLENPTAVVHESRPVKGLFGAVGKVTDGDFVRVLAAEPGLARTQLFAVGLRQPSGEHQ